MQATDHDPEDAYEFALSGFNLKKERLPPVMTEHTSKLIVSYLFTLRKNLVMHMCMGEIKTLDHLLLSLQINSKTLRKNGGRRNLQRK